VGHVDSSVICEVLLDARLHQHDERPAKTGGFAYPLSGTLIIAGFYLPYKAPLGIIDYY